MRSLLRERNVRPIIARPVRDPPPLPRAADNTLVIAPRPLDGQFAAVYDELRRIAARVRRRRDPLQTLSATDLVHDLYLRLAEKEGLVVESPQHLRALARQAMRWMLADLARQRLAERHGGGGLVTLTPEMGGSVSIDPARYLELHDALDELARIDPRQAQVTEARMFGYTLPEIAEELGMSVSAMKQDWALAKGWLHSRLSDAGHTATP